MAILVTALAGAVLAVVLVGSVLVLGLVVGATWLALAVIRSCPSPTLVGMATGGFKINKRAIEQMTREMQREFNKHPIQVPVEAAAPRRPVGLEETLTSARDELETTLAAPRGVVGPTTVYNGNVYNITGDRAQLAVGNTGPVVQGQGAVGQRIAPGFEAIAAAVALTLHGLPAAGLPSHDTELARTAAEEVLTEVGKEAPDTSLVRRGVAALKGVLSPLAMGMQKGAGEGTQDWARTAVEQLGQSFGLQ